jgi:hypothetical protein
MRSPRRQRIVLASRLVRIMHVVVAMRVSDLDRTVLQQVTSGPLEWRSFARLTMMGSILALLAPIMGYLEFRLQVRLELHRASPASGLRQPQPQRRATPPPTCSRGCRSCL